MSRLAKLHARPQPEAPPAPRFVGIPSHAVSLDPDGRAHVVTRGVVRADGEEVPVVLTTALPELIPRRGAGFKRYITERQGLHERFLLQLGASCTAESKATQEGLDREVRELVARGSHHDQVASLQGVDRLPRSDFNRGRRPEPPG